MSQNELACVGKAVIAIFGYFISTGLIGAFLSMLIDPESIPENFSAMAWIIGGIAFVLLAMCV